MNDNVIEFPTKYKGKNVPIIDDLDAVKMREDLDFADNLAEGLMINLIHNVGENGFDIKLQNYEQSKPQELLHSAEIAIKAIRARFEKDGATNLANISDEILGVLDQTSYLLTLS